MGLCVSDRDPSKLFSNSAPAPRQAVWREGEAVRLVKAAWRSGYKGLAACMAVAWDSQLSPVDARTVKASELRRAEHVLRKSANWRRSSGPKTCARMSAKSWPNVSFWNKERPSDCGRSQHRRGAQRGSSPDTPPGARAALRRWQAEPIQTLCLPRWATACRTRTGCIRPMPRFSCPKSGMQTRRASAVGSS
jgi:hypothetical protein